MDKNDWAMEAFAAAYLDEIETPAFVGGGDFTRHVRPVSVE